MRSTESSHSHEDNNVPPEAELLCELVRRYSPSTEEAPAVAYLVEWLAAHGFDARIDESGNAIGQRGDEDAPNTLLLLGHIDTVPGEITVRVEDGCLYGRGSVDAKGSLCAFAQAAATANIPAGWRVIVAGAVEEEIATSRGAYHLRETLAEPSLCVIGEPSGAGRITLGYKGRLLVDYRLRREIRHTARPEPSVGALGAEFWAQINAWAARENKDKPRYFDQVMPDLRSINTASDHFYETLTMTVGFRLPPTHPPEDVLSQVHEFAQPDGELRGYSAEQAYRGDKNNPLVRGMLAAIRRAGARPEFVLKTGTSDMNVVGARWRCPLIAYGPGDSNLDHTPNEHLPLSEYAQAVATLRDFIERLGG
jgi:[amino group carrier protein]-lysine/ornithine hydrolase